MFALIFVDLTGNGLLPLQKGFLEDELWGHFDFGGTCLRGGSCNVREHSGGIPSFDEERKPGRVFSCQ
jgi:hypothetical protein